MSSVTIQKKNLAGEVVFQYQGKILHRGPTSIQVEAFFGRDDMTLVNVMLKKGDRFVETFFTDRWYNIFAIHDRDDGMLKGWYCNVGKPAVIEPASVSYVDLALDLWVDIEGTQWVLDEDELESLDLGQDEKRKVYQTMANLQEAFKLKRPPF